MLLNRTHLIGAILAGLACGFLVVFIIMSAETPAEAVEKNNIAENSEAANKLIGSAKTEQQKLSVLFVGDIMLDRNVFVAEQRAKDWAHPFLLAAPVLDAVDLRVANLEGPITTTPFSMKRAHEEIRFTFNPKFIPELAKHFDVVSLANNHTLNFGVEGLASTKKYLQENNVAWFGDPQNRENSIATTTVRGGFKIALMGYLGLYDKNEIGFKKVLATIQQLRPGADYVVVVPHWGVEYISTPTDLQVRQAHAFVDAGADAVIGGHPHVVESNEIYKGKKIYYSLGNFIFDQYFSSETMHGLGVRVDLTRAGENNLVQEKFTELPVEINAQSQPVFAQ